MLTLRDLAQRGRAQRPGPGPITDHTRHKENIWPTLGKFYQDDVQLPFFDMGINYGLNKVRFTNPVRSGNQARGRFVLSVLTDIDKGIQMNWTIT